ncbi:MAG: hypothetical protein K6G67_01935 [Lachnospiraceae bacterium]|nr:hypothetical protein [Lachnospiraceae bacterium]
MELYSAAFIGFILISVLLHEAVGKRRGDRQWVIRLAVSVVFYAAVSKWRMIFLAVSMASVWLGTKMMDRVSGKDFGETVSKSVIKRRKRMIAAVLVTVNIGILAVTKYLLPVVDHPILLPLGISYYTLMAVSYVIDVYGEKYKAEDNPAKLALYLVWFPQMLQGPINRYDNMQHTLFEPHKISADSVKKCVLLFMFGAFKKYAIANVMIGPVGEIFGGDLGQKPGGFLFIGAVLYALCQYADFSGGIDMMMAASVLFGVRMDINFRQPYFARSIADFWRRWHITLGSFMRDYVFYPFATQRHVMKLSKKLGKKFGKHAARSVIGGMSNVLVFFLVGLWHGPKIHFVLWGLYNGVIIALSDALTPAFARMRTLCRINEKGRIWDGFRIIRTFVIICFAGYFDCIERPADSFIAFKNTLLHFNASLSRLWVIDLFDSKILSEQKVIVFALAVLLLIIMDVIAEKGKDAAETFLKRPLAVRWILAYAVIILFLMSFTVVGDRAGFMYAAF